jgi:hypothetical protein
METLEAYLERKHEEVTLLNGCLGTPLELRHPVSVVDVIEQKFRLAAALKAEHALHDWTLTETAWAHQGRLRAGPFEFSYDYQRADLEVRGPSFYQFDNSPVASETIYTSSGMAAISALLLGAVRVMSEADILVLPGSYGETIELIESHVPQLRLVRLKNSPGEAASHAGRLRILLLDSCAPAAAFEGTLNCARPHLDLVIFDTTCFSSGSGRIRRVLSWARRWQIPIVLVRSHTKLDSLGLEYGRLGSAVFVAREKRGAAARRLRLEDLAAEMRNAVRLFGGAALPAHFPPESLPGADRQARCGHLAQRQTDGALFCLRAVRLVGGAAFRPRTLCHFGAEASAGREADQADGGGFVRRLEKGRIAVAPCGALWF